MHTLYPTIKPYASHEVRVSDLHVLYVEETGNPEGLPVIVLHAGPGAGGDCYLRRFFDPELYRIIIFDQRGCGRSTPHAEIRENSTSLLIEDINTIRNHLGINRFMLFGGGWGSLLALLYAQQFPQQVCALLLHRIFLGRTEDINWFYHKGANLVYPDYWQEFISLVPADRQNNIAQYYAECLQGKNELARMAAAKSWGLWQARCSSIQLHQNVIDLYSDTHFALALATIESYYITNNYFIDDNQILLNSHTIRHIPTYLIHGRYDMVSPLAGAWDLNQALTNSQLSIVRDAGHSDRESGIIDALISASNEIASRGDEVC